MLPASVSLSQVWRLRSVNDLELPHKCPRRRRCGSDIRVPGAIQPNHIWSYDFVHYRLVDGRAILLLCVLDKHSRECLAIESARSSRSADVILALSRLMWLYGKLEYIRSDHGAEFSAGAVMCWLRDRYIGPAFIAPGKPWQNGFVESFNGKFREYCVDLNWFTSIDDARSTIDGWREHYNQVRPHRSLGMKSPETFAREAA